MKHSVWMHISNMCCTMFCQLHITLEKSNSSSPLMLLTNLLGFFSYFPGKITVIIFSLIFLTTNWINFSACWMVQPNLSYLSQSIVPSIFGSLGTSLVTVPFFSLEVLGKRCFCFWPYCLDLPTSLRKTQCFSAFKILKFSVMYMCMLVSVCVCCSGGMCVCVCVCVGGGC